jgi:riboflavin kinase / FMN adenylyltransferase
MEVIEDSFNTKLIYETYIALGSFDGVHLGHISLIKKTVELSKLNKCKSMVFTFKNHPLTIINPEFAPKLLMTNDVKISILESIGVDMSNLVEFDNEFMRYSPIEFITKLVGCYNVKGIVVGFNYRFGYKNLGDIKLLEQLSKELNFELHIVEPVLYEDKIISSTRIRTLISEGNIEKANEMLIKPYFLEGMVIKGKQIGRTIGFPTINLYFESMILFPKLGVYLTAVLIKGKMYKGITNIGTNPTFNGEIISIETYVLDFDEDIYGEKVKLFFVKWMRNEVKFNSREELIVQLELDKAYAIKEKIE